MKRGFHISHTLRGTRRLNVANGKEAEVEAVGSLTLKLHTGFLLQLKDVLYVPTLSRNLISVSRLDGIYMSAILARNNLL